MSLFLRIPISYLSQSKNVVFCDTFSPSVIFSIWLLKFSSWYYNTYIFLVTVHPCIISQINPTRCTILFNIFIYLFLLPTSFGHPCAHHQEKITVSMRHWYLSLCMYGVCFAGWSFTINISSRIVHPFGFICEEWWRLYIKTATFRISWL
jgi:hypothetical protein